jgi:hypothetical protein
MCARCNRCSQPPDPQQPCAPQLLRYRCASHLAGSMRCSTLPYLKRSWTS